MNARTGFAIVLTAALTALVALIIEPFLSYLLAALLLAFVLTPVQRRFEEVVGPEVAALGIIAFTTALVIVPTYLFLEATLADVPTSVEQLPELESVEVTLERALGVDLDLRSQTNELLGQATDFLTTRTSRLVRTGLHTFLGVLLFLFVLYYLLTDGEAFVDWTRQVTPLPDSVQDRLYTEAERTTWAVLKGHVFVAVVQGVVSGLGLVVLSVPDAAFWTVVMMFLAMVPIVGVAPVLGGAALYLWLEGRPLAAGFLVVYGMTVVAITDDYLRAYVIDRESSLHSAVVLLGVFGAAYLLGAIGLFVGPIVLGLYKATVEVFTDFYGLSSREDA